MDAVDEGAVDASEALAKHKDSAAPTDPKCDGSGSAHRKMVKAAGMQEARTACEGIGVKVLL